MKERAGLATVIIAFGLVNSASGVSSPNFNYRFIQSCTGLYGILEQAYLEIGDVEKHTLYFERFEALGKIVEEAELRKGGNEESARELVMDNAEFTMGALIINPSLQTFLTKNCDETYNEIIDFYLPSEDPLLPTAFTIDRYAPNLAF